MLSGSTRGDDRAAVEEVLDALDSGTLRVSEKVDGVWRVNEWLKKAVLLSFRLNDSSAMPGAGGAPVWDKVAMKTEGWGANHFAEAGFRAVPGAVVRRSAYIAPGVILMPSFVNVGAYVDRGTMVDTWATVGSCAQVGKNCHLSGGVGLGGVLEPLQANPTIIEDDCFIGGAVGGCGGGCRGAGERVVDGGVHQWVDQDRRSGDGGDFCGAGAGVFGGGAWDVAGAGVPGRVAWAEPGLRGDREAGRRADAGEDVDQRVAAGLMDPLPLAQALIRCRVCDAGGRGGRRMWWRGRWRGWGSGFGGCRLGARRTCSRGGVWGGRICVSPGTRMWCLRGRGGWSVDPFGGEVRDGVLMGRGACDMKGAIAAFVAAVGAEPVGAGSISLLITGDEEGPSTDGTVRVLEWMAEAGHIPDLLSGGGADEPVAVGGGDQDWAAGEFERVDHGAWGAGAFGVSAEGGQPGSSAGSGFGGV